jgi:hypothetical protein
MPRGIIGELLEVGPRDESPVHVPANTMDTSNRRFFHTRER